jgi:hypothetical protein
VLPCATGFASAVFPSPSAKGTFHEADDKSNNWPQGFRRQSTGIASGTGLLQFVRVPMHRDVLAIQSAMRRFWRETSHVGIAIVHRFGQQRFDFRFEILVPADELVTHDAFPIDEKHGWQVRQRYFFDP